MIKNTLLFGVFVLDIKGKHSFPKEKLRYKMKLYVLLFQEEGFPLHTKKLFKYSIYKYERFNRMIRVYLLKRAKCIIKLELEQLLSCFLIFSVG